MEEIFGYCTEMEKEQEKKSPFLLNVSDEAGYLLAEFR